jgi:hypothetical protein
MHPPHLSSDYMQILTWFVVADTSGVRCSKFQRRRCCCDWEMVVLLDEGDQAWLSTATRGSWFIDELPYV